MKLAAGITEPHPLWTTLLDQEKISYEVARSGPFDPAEFPVLLVPQKPASALSSALGQYLSQGGVVVCSKKVAGDFPQESRSRILTVELPFAENFFYKGDARKRFICGEIQVTETVAREPLHKIRRDLAKVLKRAFWRQGLPYARLSYYPFPYENVFSFRFDLDNYVENDFQVLCRLIEEYPGRTSCFVNMKSHENAVEALKKLSKLPTEVGSHAYIHHVYNSYEQNTFNVEKSEHLLKPVTDRIEGFSGPHGRWTPSLQRVLEERGYLYSSEFCLDYDGLPFFTYAGNRRSPVLQIPVHPVCEGIFMEQFSNGATAKIHEYFRCLIQDKLFSEEPILIFGHPDNRIGRHPDIFRRLLQDLDSHGRKIWQTEFRNFARWWKKRQSWTFKADSKDGQIRVQDFPKDDEASLELIFEKSRVRLRRNQLGKLLPQKEIDSWAKAYSEGVPQIREEGIPSPGIKKLGRNLKLWLDWETKTPGDLYRTKSLPDFLRSALRKVYDKFIAPRKISKDLWGYS